MTNRLLGAVLVALVLGAFTAYTDAIRRDEKLKALIVDVREMKKEIKFLTQNAHVHPVGPGVAAMQPIPE